MKQPEENNQSSSPLITRIIQGLTAATVVTLSIHFLDFGSDLPDREKTEHKKNDNSALVENVPTQVNYAAMLKDTRTLIREQNYSQAAANLDQLAKSQENKILLEVAKMRIRKDTPLYSYNLASNILLNLIEVRTVRGEAAFLLARHHMNALDTAQQKKARDFLYQAVEWDYHKAHAYLGNIYSKGIGTQRNFIQALSHYETAAARFSSAPIVAFARRIVALKAEETTCGINPERIIKRHLPSLQIEARGGKVSAAKELGRIFYKGNLVKRDLVEARKWLNLAATSGNAGAMRDLAILEMKFPVSEQSIDVAVLLLEKSAKAGNASAYTSLGRIYIKDDAPEMQLKAIEAFETAALSGHKAAIKELKALNRKFAASVNVDPIVTGSIQNATKNADTQDKPDISQEILNSISTSQPDESVSCEILNDEDMVGIREYLQ